MNLWYLNKNHKILINQIKIEINFQTKLFDKNILWKAYLEKKIKKESAQIKISGNFCGIKT